jgi:hypothetical protein
MRRAGWEPLLQSSSPGCVFEKVYTSNGNWDPHKLYRSRSTKWGLGRGLTTIRRLRGGMQQNAHRTSDFDGFFKTTPGPVARCLEQGNEHSHSKSCWEVLDYPSSYSPVKTVWSTRLYRSEGSTHRSVTLQQLQRRKIHSPLILFISSAALKTNLQTNVEWVSWHQQAKLYVHRIQTDTELLS